MKTIVLYYSFGGRTKTEAERISEKTGAVLCRVEEEKNRNLWTATILGCPQAIKRKSTPIKPFHCDLDAFDKIIIGAPIWAGFPAPAFNSMVQALPAGKEVDLFLCSGGGTAPKSKQGTMDLIASKGCNLGSYEDICTGNKKQNCKR